MACSSFRLSRVPPETYSPSWICENMNSMVNIWTCIKRNHWAIPESSLWSSCLKRLKSAGLCCWRPEPMLSATCCTHWSSFLLHRLPHSLPPPMWPLWPPSPPASLWPCPLRRQLPAPLHFRRFAGPRVQNGSQQVHKSSSAFQSSPPHTNTHSLIPTVVQRRPRPFSSHSTILENLITSFFSHTQ